MISATRPLGLGSCTMEAGGAHLMNAGVQSWGIFDAEDLANLKGSIEDSLREASVNPDPSMDRTLRVHIVLRRHYVGSTNHSASVFAGVSWCITEGASRILFKEEFYVVEEAHLIGTLGGVKDVVNRRIARRILDSALDIATTGTRKERTFEGTTTFFEAAVDRMPTTLRSWGLYIPGAGIAIPPSKRQWVDLGWGELDPYDWNSRLPEGR